MEHKGKVLKREQVLDEFKWRICDVYKDDSLWQADYDKIPGLLDKLGKFAGTLGKAEGLLGFMKLSDEVGLILERIYVYAHLKLFEDTSNTFYQGLVDKAVGLKAKQMAATAFFQPEVIKLDDEVLLSFIKENPKLKIYEHYFEDLLRQKAHVLSEEVEEVLANAYQMSETAQSAFTMLTNADMKFDMVDDGKGNMLELTHGRYFSMMESELPDIRMNAFKTYYKEYLKHKNTLASTYSSSLKSDLFFSSTRKHDSSLACELHGDNIPSEVYMNLISSVEKNLSALHKYVGIRKKLLGLDELHMYDIYTPLVKNMSALVPLENAKQIVLSALAPMGDEYTAILSEGLDGGWIDVYENEGKRSGAYCWGVYGCHPFVSLNYSNTLDDMFTLAHEMGHAMHRYYSSSAQPYIYADHTIFVAEVASTVNEVLLINYLLKNSKGNEQLTYLYNYFLEQFRGTFFRQTMFAEFEMIVHKMTAESEALTVDILSDVYLNLNKKYYGDEIVHDPEIAMEWARIPHFYNSFYVYQYATGYAAAIRFAKLILEHGAPAAEKYIAFLKSGSTDYSINILKKAGVDMTDPEVIKDAIGMFNEILAKFSEATDK